MSADKDKIFAGCEDGTVYAYDRSSDTKKLFASYKGSRIENIVYSSGGKYLIITTSGGAIHIFNSQGSPVKTLTESSSVDFIIANDDAGWLAEAMANRLIKIYDLNDLSRKPVEIDDITIPVAALSYTEQGNLYVALSNNTLRRYALRSSGLQRLIKNQINRNLSPEEWNTYIGHDVPYRATVPENKKH